MEFRFGNWPIITSDDYKQIKRIESARKLKKKIVEFDSDAKTIRIQGSASEPYFTTMTQCNCSDFVIDHASHPCKHMYALGFELGIMSDLPQYDKSKATFHLDAEIAKFRELYENGCISADSYVKLRELFDKL